MIDAYAHLDATVPDPLRETEDRLARAGVDRAFVVETWAGRERAVLEELALRGDTNRPVAFCHRDQPEKEIRALLQQPAVRALRARTASLEQPAPWLTALEESGRLLLCHGELGIERLLQALQRVSREHPRLGIYVPHLGWPRREKVDDPAWTECIAALCALPRVVLGVSGFASFSTQPFPHDDLRPLADAAIATFPPDRLVAATDFPNIEKGLYSESYHLARNWITRLRPEWNDHDALTR